MKDSRPWAILNNAIWNRPLRLVIDGLRDDGAGIPDLSIVSGVLNLNLKAEILPNPTL